MSLSQRKMKFSWNLISFNYREILAAKFGEIFIKLSSEWPSKSQLRIIFTPLCNKARSISFRRVTLLWRITFQREFRRVRALNGDVSIGAEIRESRGRKVSFVPRRAAKIRRRELACRNWIQTRENLLATLIIPTLRLAVTRMLVRCE